MKTVVTSLALLLALSACSSFSPAPRRTAQSSGDAYARGSVPASQFIADAETCHRQGESAQPAGRKGYDKGFDGCMREKGYVKKVQ